MKKLSLLEKYYPQFLLLIIAFTFFTRIFRLHIPEKYIFDEVYHAVTAKLIAKGDTRAYEWSNPPPEPNTAVDWLHPPYAKYTQAFSIIIFGENTFSWRFPSVIFGCLVILLTAKIAEELFKDKTLALIAAFLASLDGLIFAMSRIAMNDIHVTAFILLSLFYYVRFMNLHRKEKKFLLFSGVAAGFAVGSKWSGAFIVAILSISEAIQIIKPLFLKLITSYKKTGKISLHVLASKKQIKTTFSEIGLALVSFIVLPILLYLLSYAHMFMLGKDFHHLVEMHKNTWWYQTNLTATHPAQSKPIQWFLNTKPVWFSIILPEKDMRGDIYAIGNPVLFLFGGFAIIISTIGILLHRFVKPVEKFTKYHASVAFLLIVYFSLWVPWQASPRIMFFYHYLPAVPLMCINLAFWLKKILEDKKIYMITPFIIGLVVTAFIIWYPHMTLIPVPIKFKEAIYFYFDFWKQS